MAREKSTGWEDLDHAYQVLKKSTGKEVSSAFILYVYFWLQQYCGVRINVLAKKFKTTPKGIAKSLAEGCKIGVPSTIAQAIRDAQGLKRAQKNRAKA